MTIYKLNRYNLIEEEDVCYEHEDASMVATEAIRLCTEDKGVYTYRMEKWKNEEIVGGWRFFQDGREFTGDIANAFSIT